MTARHLVIIQGGKQDQIDSAAEQLDLSSVRIGVNLHPITDGGAGIIDFNGRKLLTADGTAPGHASSKGQLDSAVSTLAGSISSNVSSLQGQIDTIDSQIVAIGVEDANQDAEIGSLTTDLTAILTNTPKEESFIGNGILVDFTLTTFAFDASNAKWDIEVYVNGRRQTLDTTATNSQDWQKTDTTTIHFVVPPANGARVTIFKQGTSSGSSGSLSNDTTVKLAKNTTVSTIVAGTIVEKLATGGIQPATAASSNEMIGVALDAIGAAGFGRIKLLGENVAGAIAGLGFTPGQELFLGNAGGYTNDPNTVPGTSTLWRIGIADCGDNSFSATATDLIMFATPVLRP